MYAKIINQQVVQYPYTDSDLRIDYPNTSFPAIITDDIRTSFNVFEIVTSNTPDHDDRTQKIQETLPTLKDNVWTQTWQVIDLTLDEIQELKNKKIQQIKNARLQELQRTDYTQLPDVNLANKQEWAQYRQALRDITQQPDFPYNIIWPVEPNSNSNNTDASSE